MCGRPPQGGTIELHGKCEGENTLTTEYTIIAVYQHEDQSCANESQRSHYETRIKLYLKFETSA